MTLPAGSRLGPYVIETRLGAGGMGEVYRAHDERLDRRVAIKALSPACAADEQFRERFRREARALSKLSHPNVCAVFDVGTDNGRDYFVMDLLDGETLASRLERGPIPLAEAVAIARQIAGALAASHRLGIVHRDLKPANVMLTASGVKLLDFGLARIAPGAASEATISNALTAFGTLLGTYPYMSPEQVNGQHADARSDVFSFGVVLYEMITGQRAFPGDTQASLTASILRDDPPPIRTLQPAAPDELVAIVHSCLAKQRDERWQSAYDLYLELGWVADRLRRPHGTHPAGDGRRAGWIWIAAAAIAGFLAAVAAIGRERPPSTAERPALHTTILPPENSQFISIGIQAGPAVLSPDGRRVAFVASSAEGRPRLWVRSLTSSIAQALNATEGASYPFWSPDGEQLGFFADRKLKKVVIATGAVTTLCDVSYGAGGTWNRDGTIVFAPGGSEGLQRISAVSGSPRAATVLDATRGESAHRWPAFLPDGRRFLYAAGQKERSGNWRIRVASLDSDRVDDVLDGNSNGVFVNGAILFARRGTLLAQRVDERSLGVIGEPVPLAENVLHDVELGRAVFSVSQTGLLLYQLGSAAAGARLVWLDRSGREHSVVNETCLCIWPRLSPDGTRAAVAITDPTTGNGDIWIYDLADNRRVHLTFEDTFEAYPVWSHDASHVIFSSTRNGIRDIYWKDALGRGSQEVLRHSDADKYVQSASAHGVVFTEKSSLWLLPLGTPAQVPRLLVKGEPNVLFGSISPDSQWFLYQSYEGGRNNIYVTSFPGMSGKWPVSEDGGILPKWSADGHEIFYLSQDHSMLFAAAVNPQGTAFRTSTVQRLFSAPMVIGRGYPYDVSPDGQRFLVVKSSGATTPLTLVVDWALKW